MLQSGDDSGSLPLDPGRMKLTDEPPVKAIHDQARHVIRLSMDEAISGDISGEQGPQTQRALDAPGVERLVDELVAVEREQAKGETVARIEMATSDPLTPTRHQIDHRAG